MKGQILSYPDLDHKVRSSWEANYCRILKRLQIPYSYEAKTFTLPSGRTYTPDIMLRDNLFVEVKGFMDDNSQGIIEEFRATYLNISLVVVDSKHYRALMDHYFTMSLMAEKTKVSKAHTKFQGLRTSVPWSFVQDWKLKPGDTLIWERRAEGNKIIVVVRKAEKGED